MFPAKLLLLLELFLLFSLKVSEIFRDARFSLECEEPQLQIWEKFVVWLGILEKSTVCLTTEEIVQNTARALFGAIFSLIICEVIRTIGCYFILFEGHTELVVPEGNLRSNQFVNWNLILRRNPKFVISTRRWEDNFEYMVRTVNMLTTTTLTYNVRTGRVHSWTRPRLFVC